MDINTSINGETSIALSYVGTFGNKFINNNTPQVYSNISLNNITVFYDNNTNKYWFIGKEVAMMLMYSDTWDAINKHVSLNNKIIYPVKLINRLLTGDSPVSPHSSNIVIITEDGLYELIMSSKMPNAEYFKQYVFNLLHKIREYGDPYENKIPVVDIIPENVRKYFNRRISNMERIHHKELCNQYNEWDKYYKQEKQSWEYKYNHDICNCNAYYQNALNYGAYQYDMLRADSINKDKEINDLKQELSNTRQELSDFKSQASIILNILMEEFNNRNNINKSTIIDIE